MFEIYRTGEFEEKFKKLGKFEQTRIIKIIEQLKEHGYEVGDPLSGLSFLREKKFNGRRLYYLIYLPWECILMVSISGKKDQDQVIGRIVQSLKEYKEYVQKIHFERN